MNKIRLIRNKRDGGLYADWKRQMENFFLLAKKKNDIDGSLHHKRIITDQ